MSKKYTAVVENGAIRIETPDLENGTAVEIIVDKRLTLFERLEQITVVGLPDDFSTAHKPKETPE